MNTKWIALASMMLASAVGSPTLWAGASVHIDTTFTLVEEGYAITCTHEPSGSFSAVIDDAPKPHDEWIVGDPTYTWTISPSKSLTFAPTDASTVNLTLGADAFGKSYGVALKVKWVETNDKTGASHEIVALAALTLDAVSIETETVSPVPENQKRRKLGIAEKVIIRITPPVDAEWFVEGGGSVNITRSDNTTFSASRSPSEPIIYARIGNFSCSVSFNVVAPRGQTASIKQGVFFDESVKEGTNYISAATSFACYVLPQDVSFGGATFRENIPNQSSVWPDGTSCTRNEEIVIWTPDMSNLNIDNVLSDQFPVAKLFNGSHYVDFTFPIQVPQEYLNQNNVWVSWLPNETHTREYRGADLKARIRYQVSNTIYGPWMGPWE